MKNSILFCLAITSIPAVQAGGWTCDSPGFHCGPGYVCQMKQPPHCASCPAQPQCVLPSTCDGVDCGAGQECVVNNPPTWCYQCQPQAVCRPQQNGVGTCGTGEAYDYQEKACVPVTCDSDDACTDGTVCAPASPGLRYCKRQYQLTGVPCKYFTCESPCTAALCGEGEICKAVQQGNQVVAECVCNTPLYVFNDFEQKCVPNSCDVPTACAADEVCIPGGDPDCMGNCRPYTCRPANPPTYPSCDDGYEFDEYQHKCVAVSCAADPCPGNLICLDDDSIPCAKTPCFRYSCVHPSSQCGEGYEYNGSNCVPVTCAASTACAPHQTCIDKPYKPCNSAHVVCQKFICRDQPTDPCAAVSCVQGSYCDKGQCCPLDTEYDEVTKECVAVTCDAPHPCEAGKVCKPATKTCVRAPCPQFDCEDPPSDPCSAVYCPHGLVCKVESHGPQCVCPDNYEWHPGYRCQPKNCEAENPCPAQQTCVPYDRYCPHPGPCPQYYCKHGY